MTSFHDDALVPRVRAAGAIGYLLKDVAADGLIDAVRSANAGKSTLAPEGAQALVKHVVDPEISFAWQQMASRRGRLRVDQLAGKIGWSRKRLWSQFRSQVGITPKRAAQLVRFDRAAHRLAAGQSIAQVALESGYVDQSHLNREVTAFAGVTPTAVALAPWLGVDDIAWPARGRRFHTTSTTIAA